MKLPGFKNRYNQIKPGYIFAADIICIGIALVIFSLFHHVLPRKLEAEGSSTAESNLAESESSQPDAESVQNQEDSVSFAFSDKYTSGSVSAGDNEYKSSDINISIDTVEGNNMKYYVADIYVKDITKIKTAFAKGTYGKAITDTVLNMSEENDAVLAVNGDYYGTGESGVVIRNGILYRDTVNNDVCVLFKDGTMKVYDKESFNSSEVMEEGAWQAWSFGPSLLSDSGDVITKFSSRISNNNPRTAVGYIEPGHYCLVVVDGRQSNSKGASLAELSGIMNKLGCKAAYNLDGGQSSVMTFEDKIVNSPVKGGRKVSDIVYIGE